MATELLYGQRTWGGNIDADGHRNWSITFMTKGDPGDGPAQHLQTPGLPIVGSFWAFDNDLDLWAWCRHGPTSISPVQGKGEQNSHFEIVIPFSTAPPNSHRGSGGGSKPSGGHDDKGAKKKCADQKIEDPLAEPPSTSGSAIRYSEEEDTDRHGLPIAYTSGEKIRGAQVEFDKHRDQVIVEQNVLRLNYATLRGLVGRLNSTPMWDLPARCWKLADFTWARKLYGTCNFYFTIRAVFESNAIELPSDSPIGVAGSWWMVNNLVLTLNGKHYLSGWDRNVLDESSKVLSGHWNHVTGAWTDDNVNGSAPDPTNPRHYIKAIGYDYTPQRIILSRSSLGRPATGPTDANYIHIEKNDEADFLSLGVPTSLE